MGNTAGLVVVAIPRDAYDTIMETLEMDEQSSAFDVGLRREIRDARKSVCELHPELEALLTTAAALFTGAGGTITAMQAALVTLTNRLLLASTPNLVADAVDGEEEDGAQS